ncbi:hypothetical protein BOW47_12175 [Solemya velum gill symbiont]|nr:hypothetical protein BOW43_12210 [Solemya velum gill symbiont]OOZ58619.1 hypothetical protein BOW44_13010 [Solemya velum gill symbiont]OOZ66711.1 hypothetical protein BOW47_12175 [Solemya velum gill symbiont]OOZ72180.1 hypothetical protein BOW49_11305 [Solemya velum gill symbiont]
MLGFVRHFMGFEILGDGENVNISQHTHGVRSLPRPLRADFALPSNVCFLGVEGSMLRFVKHLMGFVFFCASSELISPSLPLSSGQLKAHHDIGNDRYYRESSVCTDGLLWFWRRRLNRRIQVDNQANLAQDRDNPLNPISRRFAHIL